MSAAKVNSFVHAFMVKAKDTVDDEAYEAIIAMWNGGENQAELAASFKPGRKSGSKGKKLKDKNAPKRGSSAYIYFCKDFRAAAKAELGDDATLGQVGKELGRLWHEAKYAEKVGKYNKLAAEDKKRYLKEMETYERPSDEELEEQNKGKRKKGGKKKRKSSGKKRGKSAYMFFCAEERLKIREEDPELAPREVMSELGRRWKEAKKGDTSKWDELAKESKEEAAKANSSGEEEGPKPSVSKPKPKPKDEDDDDDELVEEEEDELVEEKKQPTKTSTKKPLWKAKLDKGSGKTYYYNTKTRKTQWAKPAAMDDEEPPAPKTPTKSSVKKTKSSTKKSSKKKRVYGSVYWKEQHKDEVAKESGLSGGALTKELSKRWKAFSKEDKAEWTVKAKAAAE